MLRRSSSLKLSTTNSKGFTLIEIVLGMAIVAILVTIVVRSFPNVYEARELDRATELVVNMLTDARARTLSAEDDMQYGVYVTATSTVAGAANTIVLHSGAGYVASPSNALVTTSLPSNVFFRRAMGGGRGTIFMRLTGESRTGTSTGDYFLLQTKGTTQVRRISVDRSGNISVGSGIMTAPN